jgi:hypothetical protein
MSLVSRANLRQISTLKRYSSGFDMTLRCYVGARVFLKSCKLRNHLQSGGSPYLPASHRTKAVKPIIDNCAKVRSRRTINLVLFTNRPRCCARGYPNEKLVLKCDREFKKVQRCKNSTPLAASLVASYRVGKSLRCQREERYTTRGTLMPDRAIPWAKKTRPGR